MMGFLSGIFGKAIASPIDAVSNAIDNLHFSGQEKAKAKFVLEKLRQQPNILQIELNKVEAQHRSIFVSGWRSAIGWTCACGLFCASVINPIIIAIVTHTIPVFQTDVLKELVIALLGLGAMRTFEKFSGRAK